ncbi:hypothetical protein [Mycobacterium malmoense]|uniref:hypothetical protein n=1 Tax=Mycobacterium malmoense TaxID=1780 RepID=UPI00223D231B|nr:hypothetical protein [Mycobacterium malmoense]
MGKVRRDIEADGQESRQIAAAVSRAEGDVRACKRELDEIERAADAHGWAVTPDWRIEVGDTWIGRDRMELAAQQQLLQDQLNAVRQHAHRADQELAAAVRGAVSDVPVDAGAHPPSGGQGVPNPAGGGQPRSLEDMLPTGKQPTSGQGDQPPPGSLPDLLSRLNQPVALRAPSTQPKPAEVESFKTMARQSMIRDGVPPDQIEARLDDVVGRTQRWIDKGMPSYVPPEPKAPPPPGFAEGFGDRWFATEQGIKSLVGQGGPGAPGVLESWEQMLKGTVETVQNPVGTAIGEVKNAFDSPTPAYYLGAKTSDAATTLPWLVFGGEGAAAGELGDIGPGALDTGPAVSPHAPVGFDHPFGYNPWAEQAATDLTSAFGHGGPTTSLSRQLADMSTHYVGDDPDRVVLGKFDGQQNGYIGDARGHGGIYFDTGDPTWDAITSGLSESEAKSLAWQVNEQFLRSQLENHVGRIEYLLDRDKYSSLEDMMFGRTGSFSAMEVEFLSKNAVAYGYQRIGDAWVYVGGG